MQLLLLLCYSIANFVNAVVVANAMVLKHLIAQQEIDLPLP